MKRKETEIYLTEVLNPSELCEKIVKNANHETLKGFIFDMFNYLCQDDPGMADALAFECRKIARAKLEDFFEEKTEAAYKKADE